MKKIKKNSVMLNVTDGYYTYDVIFTTRKRTHGSICHELLGILHDLGAKTAVVETTYVGHTGEIDHTIVSRITLPTVLL